MRLQRPGIRPRAGAACVVLLVVGVLSGPSAHGRSASRDDRDQIRTQRAALALEIDTMEADNADIDRALSDLESNVRAQQAELADARRAAEDAQRRAFEAAVGAAAKEQELVALQDRLASLAVEAYVNPPGHDLLDRFKADTASQAAQKQALIGARATQVGDLVDEVRGARRALAEEQAAAEAARIDADRRAAEAETRLVDLENARMQQSLFAADVETRLNAKLAEAAALAEFDAELAAQVMAEQEALAARIRDIPPPPPVVDVGPGPTPSPGPGTPPPVTSPPGPGPTPPPVTSPPTTSPPPVTPPPVGPVPLQTVRGITVNASIAAQLEGLLAAAAADGFVLSGYGYRDSAAQIALRRAHCGTSDYAIWQMPAMSCSPPTAIPGTSMHERGLAVDFSWNGRAITSQSSPAFQWMAANAGRFGFINLPSEPWHWSVTGR